MAGSKGSHKARAEGKTSTLDLLHFENIRDQGIIETPTSYAMLLEIEPRDWLTLSEERRSNLYIAYLTYLRGLSYPTQILSMTTPFDASDYFDQFIRPPAIETTAPVETGERDAEEQSISADGGTVPPVDTVGDSPLLEYGRLTHVEWLGQMLSEGQVRDRRFFVAVGVNKGEDDDENAGFLNRLQGMFSVMGSAQEISDEEPYLDEVWARAHRVASQLPRTEVGTTVLDNREDVLSVLYHSFRGTPPAIGFDHASFTRADEDALIDPVSGDQLDLETAFAEADAEALSKTPDRPKTDDLPYQGRVAPELVTKVDRSRLLQWYVRNIAPLGVGRNSSTPLSVYGGVAMFVLAVVLGIGAFATFSATGTVSSRANYWLLREGSFLFAAGALPMFLVGLVVLLPSSRRARVLGVLGSSIIAVAIYLFQAAYPAVWDSDMGQTTTVLEVYGVGILILVLAVGMAVRQRRGALGEEDENEADIDDPEPSAGE